MNKNCILSGLIPSENGCHLGHYIGNIQPIINLQDTENCFFILGDFHLISRIGIHRMERTESDNNILQMLSELVALGVNPAKVTIYCQSQIEYIYGLLLMCLSDLVSMKRLNKFPAIKAVINKPNNLSLYQFPIYQIIDIISIGTNIVVSNADNKPIIELTNELLRKVNHTFDCSIPHIELQTGIIHQMIGTDGRKMSKAHNNCIFISDTKEILFKKIRRMNSEVVMDEFGIPDPTKCVALIYSNIFIKNKSDVKELENLYRKKKVNDLDIKDHLYKNLNLFLEPVREMARELFEKKKEMFELLLLGGEKAKKKLVSAETEYYHNLVSMYKYGYHA